MELDSLLWHRVTLVKRSEEEDTWEVSEVNSIDEQVTMLFLLGVKDLQKGDVLKLVKN